MLGPPVSSFMGVVARETCPHSPTATLFPPGWETARLRRRGEAAILSSSTRNEKTAGRRSSVPSRKAIVRYAALNAIWFFRR